MHSLHRARSAAPARLSLAAIFFALCSAQQAFAECELASEWEIDSVDNLSAQGPIERGDQIRIESEGTAREVTLVHHSAGGQEVSLCDQLDKVTTTEIACGYDDEGVPKRFFAEMIKGSGRDTASCVDGVPPWLSDEACEAYQCVILWSNRTRPAAASGPSRGAGNPDDGDGTGGNDPP